MLLFDNFEPYHRGQFSLPDFCAGFILTLFQPVTTFVVCSLIYLMIIDSLYSLYCKHYGPEDQNCLLKIISMNIKVL